MIAAHPESLTEDERAEVLAEMARDATHARTDGDALPCGLDATAMVRLGDGDEVDCPLCVLALARGAR